MPDTTKIMPGMKGLKAVQGVVLLNFFLRNKKGRLAPPHYFSGC
jgi:hypothetical protein